MLSIERNKLIESKKIQSFMIQEKANAILSYHHMVIKDKNSKQFILLVNIN